MLTHDKLKVPSQEKTTKLRNAVVADLDAINGFYRTEYGAEYPSFLTSTDLVRQDVIVRVAVSVGKIIGVLQAAPLKGAAGVYESKGLVVDRQYRGHGIGKLLLEEQLHILRKRGARSVYAEPVCREAACRSQHNFLERGFSATGILPSKYPDELVGNQPESVTMSALSLTGDVWGLRPTYLPKNYETVMQKVLPKKTSVQSVPRDAMPHVLAHAPEIAEGRYGSAFVEIPINWPKALDDIAKYQSLGYLFAGVLPGVHQTALGKPYDVAVFYLPPKGIRIDFERINVTNTLMPLHTFMAAEYTQRYG
ncbi:MAG: GNAT family N-acetyltransferase [Patescibacteria group bacterium]